MKREKDIIIDIYFDKQEEEKNNYNYKVKYFVEGKGWLQTETNKRPARWLYSDFRTHKLMHGDKIGNIVFYNIEKNRVDYVCVRDGDGYKIFKFYKTYKK